MNSILGGHTRFLAKGGKILMNYNHVTMELNEVVDILDKMPKLGGRTYIAEQRIIYHTVYV